jgi:hypothetical protein
MHPVYESPYEFQLEINGYTIKSIIMHEKLII